MEFIQKVVAFVQGHLVEISVIYLFVLNTLKGLHDALEVVGVEKKDGSILDKVIAVMSKLSAYLVVGKRA